MITMAEEKKATPKKKNRNFITKTKYYKKKKYCPKCGPGFHLAEHKDRMSCGRCGYYEKK